MASLERILAPFLMGTVFNVFLYGIMVNQCYLYNIWYKRDKVVIKSVVAFLLLLDTITCAFYIAMSYGYLVTDFGNFERITVLNTGLLPYPLMTGVSAFVVQCFYGWRIQILTGLRYLSLCIYTLSTIQLLASIGATIGGCIVKEFIHLDRTKAISLLWLVGSSVTDIVITCSLVWYLKRGKTGFRDTDDVVAKIIRVTIQTGLLTSLTSVAVIIAFFFSAGTTVHIAIGLPISKLYSTSLLSTLNARRGWVPLNRLRQLTPRSRSQRSDIINNSENAPSVRFGFDTGFSSLVAAQETSKIEFTSNVQFSPMSPSGADGLTANVVGRGSNSPLKKSPIGGDGGGRSDRDGRRRGQSGGDAGYVEERFVDGGSGRRDRDLEMYGYGPALDSSLGRGSSKGLGTTEIEIGADVMRTQSTLAIESFAAKAKSDTYEPSVMEDVQSITENCN